MLRQSQHELVIKTGARSFYEITGRLEALVRETGLRTGLATMQLQHTSASLLIQENADPEVRRDLERFFARLVPDGDPLFRHTAEGDDDMPAHIRSALTLTQLSIPVEQGRMALGTWQGIYVFEHRARAHRRSVVLHLMSDS